MKVFPETVAHCSWATPREASPRGTARVAPRGSTQYLDSAHSISESITRGREAAAVAFQSPRATTHRRRKENKPSDKLVSPGGWQERERERESARVPAARGSSSGARRFRANSGPRYRRAAQSAAFVATRVAPLPPSAALISSASRCSRPRGARDAYAIEARGPQWAPTRRWHATTLEAPLARSHLDLRGGSDR